MLGLFREKKKKSGILGGIRKLVGFGTIGGVAAAYFLDPKYGPQRRSKLVNSVAGLFTSGRQAAYGLGQKAIHAPRPEQVPENDPTLAHKVESEIFRGIDVEPGQVNVNAANGVVYLRGEVKHPEDVNALEERARKVTGVRDVVNLLHLPGTTPQNKREALEASRDRTGETAEGVIKH